ncbi:9364_t:CDS:2, partial [Acaulospora colombiana]
SDRELNIDATRTTTAKSSLHFSSSLLYADAIQSLGGGRVITESVRAERVLDLEDETHADPSWPMGMPSLVIARKPIQARPVNPSSHCRTPFSSPMSSSPPAEATVNDEYAKRGVLGKIWHPRPKPPGFAEGKVIPEVSASRPLEVADLWELDDARRSDHISPILEHNFYVRCPPEKRPRHLQEQDVFTPGKEKEKQPDLSAPNGDEGDVEAQKPLTKEEEKRRKKMYDESLVWALEKTFRYNFWMGGILQLIGEAYLHARYPVLYPKGPSIGKGIGLAIGLFAMQ